MSSASLRLTAITLAALLAGCTESAGAGIGNKTEGESCKQISDCVAGLDCVEGVCTPMESPFTGPQRGDPCDNDDDCAPDLVCGRQDVCTLSHGLALDQPCGLTLDCVEPLVCNGLTGVCSDEGGAGTLDLGDGCVDITDCRRPLICGLDGECVQLPFWAGADCTRSNEDTGAFRVFFEIPSDPITTPHEFYRLPFPNDMRFEDGSLSLEGHGSPADVLGINVPETYMATVEADADGFAINQPIFFRLSNAIDHTSICLDAGSVYPELADPEDPPFCEGGGDPTVYLVRLDTNEHIPVQLALGREASHYICQNWIGVAPLDGRPLEHETTYAAVVTAAVRDIGGTNVVRDVDFESIMTGGTNVPALQPLLTWITNQSIDASTIVGATVFTTGNPDELAPGIYQAVNGGAAPTFDSGAVECTGPGTGVPPAGCAPVNAAGRGCTRAHANYRVFQGTYLAPMFQQGTRPYTNEGGAFDVVAGVPQSQGTETMCYALSTPTSGTGPFPVVIYAHGTGGNYRGFLDQNLAGDTSDTKLAAALATLGFAVISFDNVMHGPRQGSLDPADWEDPGRLFFNLANPRAARDNVLQGAADLFHLTRLLRTGTGPNGITFNADQVYFLGHSQGTVIAPAYLSEEPGIQAAVLSGAGAELALSILNKKKPADISVAAGAFFADQSISRIHPVIGLMAMVFGPADSVSYAPTWIAPSGANLPLMQFTGIGDGYTPDVTQHAQIRAAGLPLVGTTLVAIDGVNQVGSPRANNGAVQFATDGTYDGHYIMFKNPEAQPTLLHYLQTGLAGTPEVQR